MQMYPAFLSHSVRIANRFFLGGAAIPSNALVDDDDSTSTTSAHPLPRVPASSSTTIPRDVAADSADDFGPTLRPPPFAPSVPPPSKDRAVLVVVFVITRAQSSRDCFEASAVASGASSSSKGGVSVPHGIGRCFIRG